MADKSIIRATVKNCVAFQDASANAYAEARMWIDSHDQYVPRVIANQKNAAMYASEARTRLSQLIGC